VAEKEKKGGRERIEELAEGRVAAKMSLIRSKYPDIN
jgi:hypothetical protein